MNNKIEIHIDENSKAVIRVVEFGPNGILTDVRDALIQSFREQLKSTSATFTFIPINSHPDAPRARKQYDIVPVSDELEYFKQRVLVLSPFGQFPNGENYKTICKFFDDLRAVSLGDHDPEALAKFNEWTPGGLNGMVDPGV